MGTRSGISTRRFQASIVLLLVGTACRFHRGLLSLHNADDIEELMTEPMIPLFNKTNQKSTLNDAFYAQNLEWSKRKVPCGSQKCLYRIKSDPQIGYLVASEEHSSRRSILLDLGWQLAQQLERDYKIKHFLLGPPQVVKVSRDLAKRLRQNLYVEKTREMLRGKQLWRRYPRGSIIHVQKVQLAPKNHLLLGCVDAKIDSFQQDWPTFSSLVKFKESFARNFRNGLDEAKRLLKDEPCLVKDFQVIVDIRGELYHLDFDRCFGSYGRKWHMNSNITESCLDSLDKINHVVQETLMNDTTSEAEDSSSLQLTTVAR